jgi:NADH dehydrogenase FAD-containing subunit
VSDTARRPPPAPPRAQSLLRKLHCDKYDVTLISPKNYFLFTPLLASTTTGRTSKSSIIEPIRGFCKRADASDVRFVESDAVAVDIESNTVTCRDSSEIVGKRDEFEVEYDYLVVAVGAESATFNTPGVREHAVFMKQVGHSRIIRSRVLDALETACIPGQSEQEIERLLSFCVVGGGPAGVEYAGELQDFLSNDAKQAYPEVADKCSVKIIEGLPHILGRFTKDSIEFAEEQMRSSGVELMTDHFVRKVEPGAITLSHRMTKAVSTVPYGVLVWVTGIAPRPLVQALIASIGADKGQTNRRALIVRLACARAACVAAHSTARSPRCPSFIYRYILRESCSHFDSLPLTYLTMRAQLQRARPQVDDKLRVAGTDNVFAMGDCASLRRLPQTAQVASQEGKFLGRAFNEVAERLHTKHRARRASSAAGATAAAIAAEGASERERERESAAGAFESIAPFQYAHRGAMAYVGGAKVSFSFIDRYILRESCSQFDSLPLTSLTILGAKAVADFPALNQEKNDASAHHSAAGFMTYWVWRSVYLSKLLSFRNRISVGMDWTKAYVFGRDTSRHE